LSAAPAKSVMALLDKLMDEPELIRIELVERLKVGERALVLALPHLVRLGLLWTVPARRPGGGPDQLAYLVPDHIQLFLATVKDPSGHYADGHHLRLIRAFHARLLEPLIAGNSAKTIEAALGPLLTLVRDIEGGPLSGAAALFPPGSIGDTLLATGAAD
jgi:hypothetical protein